MQLSFTDCCRIAFAIELIMLRVTAGILYTPGCKWSRAETDCMLAAIGRVIV